MMGMDFRKKDFIEYTEKSSPANCLAFILLGIVAQNLLIKVFVMLAGIGNDESKMLYSMPIQLFSTLGMIVVLIIYCRKVEKRSIRGTGFGCNAKSGLGYIKGLIIGMIMFSACMIIAYLTHSAIYVGKHYKGHETYLLIMFVGFLIQGMSEEIMVRGTLMPTIASKKGILKAIIMSSLFFAILHLGNNGITLLAFINLTLFGIFAALYYYHEGSLFGIGAFHGMWNFVQGNLYGLSVSGINSGASILKFLMSAKSSRKIITGGIFGIEGSIECTIVMCIGIAYLFVKERHNLISDVK